MSDSEEITEAPASSKMVMTERPLFINPKIYSEFDAKPKAAKVKKQKKKKTVKTEHGFMYIGHLPHGFYENEVRSYFSQFGRVCKIKLARSIKSGNHKGYGFIEFENDEVAKIAAETMNNYLMFNKLLKCHVIPKEKLNKDTFKNSKKPFFLKLDSTFRKRFNSLKSDEKLERIKIKNELKMKKRQEKLNEAGIKLDLSKLSNIEEISTPESYKKEEAPKVSKSPESVVEGKKKGKSVETKKAPLQHEQKQVPEQAKPKAKKLKSKK